MTHHSHDMIYYSTFSVTIIMCHANMPISVGGHVLPTHTITSLRSGLCYVNYVMQTGHQYIAYTIVITFNSLMDRDVIC